MEILTDAAIQAVIQQGIWCLLFIILFVYTMKHNNEREQKYEIILDAQSQSLTKITDTLKTMNDKIDSIDKKVGEIEDVNRK